MTESLERYIIGEACELSQQSPDALTVHADPSQDWAVRRTVDWNIDLSVKHQLVPGKLSVASQRFASADAAKGAAERFAAFPNRDLEHIHHRLRERLEAAPGLAAGERPIGLAEGDENFTAEETCGHCRGHTREVCSRCHGAKRIKCRTCHGDGYETPSPIDPFEGEDWPFSHVCSDCRGEGTVVCPACHGQGVTTCSTCNGHGVLTHLYHLNATAAPQVAVTVDSLDPSSRLCTALSEYMAADRAMFAEHGRLEGRHFESKHGLRTLTFKEDFVVPMAQASLEYSGTTYTLAVLTQSPTVLDWDGAIEPMLAHRPISDPRNLAAAGHLRLHHDLILASLHHSKDPQKILRLMHNAVSKQYLHQALKGYGAMITTQAMHCKRTARSVGAAAFAVLLFGLYFLSTQAPALLSDIPGRGLRDWMTLHPIFAAITMASVGAFVLFRAWYLLTWRATCVKAFGKRVYNALLAVEKARALHRLGLG